MRTRTSLWPLLITAVVLGALVALSPIPGWIATAYGIIEGTVAFVRGVGEAIVLTVTSFFDTLEASRNS